jgi:hypothetical protein
MGACWRSNDGIMVVGGNAMQQAIAIVDLGRGPQLSTSRITVLDVFYYLHRGHGFDFIQRAMPTLSRAEFDAVAAYVDEHRETLLELDREADEFIRRGIEDQKAKGLYREIDDSVPLEERIARLKDKMRRQHAERNGGQTPR